VDCTYLENSSVNVFGYNIFGSPNTIEFFDWAFEKNEEELDQIYSQIPENTDIVVTHGPAYEILDLT
jgi:hypothetical protein